MKMAGSIRRFLVTAAALTVVIPLQALKLAADSPLKLIKSAPLPGNPTRFDYQSLAVESGILYLSHMGDGRMVVFNTRTDKVLANLKGFPECTGVLAAPPIHRVYVSVTGLHQVAVVDTRTLKTVARIDGPRFPDGIAYDADDGRIFVSDEFGRADWVIDSATDKVIKRIPLGGEAGNTRYDPITQQILVPVQTLNKLLVISPRTLKIIGRYPLPGIEGAHGLYIDIPHRLAYIAGEDNSRLAVFNLQTRKVISIYAVGNGPDVLALDPGADRLYVASESGEVYIFQQNGSALSLLGTYYAPHAHTIEVNPQTHQIYLPLQDVNGEPQMQILSFSPHKRR